MKVRHVLNRVRAHVGGELPHAGRLSAALRAVPHGSGVAGCACGNRRGSRPGMTTKWRTTIPASHSPAARKIRSPSGSGGRPPTRPTSRTCRCRPRRMPVDGAVALYTSRRIGTLAEIFMLDQRQYRSAQACPAAEPRRWQPRSGRTARTCRMNPAACWAPRRRPGSMPGSLAGGHGRWNLLAQGTLVLAWMDEQPGAGRMYTTDNWNGYFAARQRRARHAAAAAACAIPWCCHWATSTRVHRGATSRTTRRARQHTMLATEIVTTSVSSDRPTAVPAR